MATDIALQQDFNGTIFMGLLLITFAAISWYYEERM